MPSDCPVALTQVEHRAISSLLSTAWSATVSGSWGVRVWGRSVGAGPGVVLPKCGLSGCDVGHAGLHRRPRLPSRTAPGVVGAQLCVDDAGDSPLQCSEGFFFRLAFSKFAVVERAAGRVPVAHLGHGRDVHRVVELPVLAQRESVHAAPAGSDLDRCGAAIGGVVVAAGEPVDSAGMSDDHRGDDRSDTEDVGERRSRRRDRIGNAPFRCAHLLVDVAQIADMIGCELVSDPFHRRDRLEPVEEPLCLVRRDFSWQFRPGRARTTVRAADTRLRFRSRPRS